MSTADRNIWIGKQLHQPPYIDNRAAKAASMDKHSSKQPKWQNEANKHKEKRASNGI